MVSTVWFGIGGYDHQMTYNNGGVSRKQPLIVSLRIDFSIFPSNLNKKQCFSHFEGFSRNGALCFSEELQLLGLGKR
jgi:hypothetical protein